MRSLRRRCTVVAAADLYLSRGMCRAQGVLYSHRSNYLHALLGMMPDNLGLSAADSVLMVRLGFIDLG